MNNKRSYTKIQELIYEMKVADVMENKVISLGPLNRMSELRFVLRDNRISGVPVIEDCQLIGIISTEDYINWLACGENDCSVSKKMSKEVEILHPQEPLITAVAKLERHGYGRLPVIEKESGKVVGIVTKGKIIENLLYKLEIDYHEEEIHHYRASHLFEDVLADQLMVTLRYRVENRPLEEGGVVSSAIKKALHRLGVPRPIARRACIAAYEAEMNLLTFTPGGEITLELTRNHLHIRVEDRGPGIEDVQKAMEPGFSTAPEWVRELGFGAGMGLNNIENCSDQFEIDSQPGEGTCLQINIGMEVLCV